MMIRSMAISMALLLSACDETSRFHYATADEARKGAATLLPPVLPSSAVDIYVEFDPDPNVIEGSFRFSELDGASLKAKLEPLPGDVRRCGRLLDRQEYESKGFQFFRSADFCFAVNWTRCETHFWFPRG